MAFRSEIHLTTDKTIENIFGLTKRMYIFGLSSLLISLLYCKCCNTYLFNSL